jgi:BON domain-containing protein
MNLIDVTKGTVTLPLKVGRWALEQGAGVVQSAAGRSSSAVPKDLDDVTIARKVESVALRGRGTDKVDVNVVDGVVWLRGQVKRPEDVNAIEAATRAIPEVVDVHNLLHLPKTPAPTRSDAPPRQRRTRATASAPARPRTQPRRLNADKTIAADGEPLPKDLAAKGEGRPAAPLGSTGDDDTPGTPAP